MSERKHRSLPLWPLVVGLVPAVIAACAVLIQGGRLTTPAVPAVCYSAPQSCASAVARVMNSVAADRTAALRTGWLAVALLAVLGLAVGALSALAIRRGRRRSAADRVRSERSAPAPSRVTVRADPNGSVERLRHDRETLIRVCMEMSDLVGSQALQEQLRDALASVGVKPVEVTAGEHFDATRHHAVGKVATTDVDRHNLVAATERAGFADHGKPLRDPDVLVYRLDGESPARL